MLEHKGQLMKKDASYVKQLELLVFCEAGKVSPLAYI